MISIMGHGSLNDPGSQHGDMHFQTISKHWLDSGGSSGLWSHYPLPPHLVSQKINTLPAVLS